MKLSLRIGAPLEMTPYNITKVEEFPYGLNFNRFRYMRNNRIHKMEHARSENFCDFRKEIAIRHPGGEVTYMGEDIFEKDAYFIYRMEHPRWNKCVYYIKASELIQQLKLSKQTT